MPDTTYTPDVEVSIALSIAVEWPIETSDNVDLLLAAHAIALDVAGRVHARLVELGKYR